MKKLSFFLMAMLFSVMSFAAEASIDFSSQNIANQTAMNTVQVNDDVTITFAGGGNSNVPKYYTSGTAVRMYPKNSFTVTTTTGKLTKIVITFGSGDGTLSIASNVGNYASGTWTGEETSATLTINPTATSGNRRIKAIAVTYGEVSADYVVEPSISGDLDFIESTEVSIAAGEGLKVYYTLDGTDPTNASPEYTAPFEVKETTTVKAIAYNGENASAVASKTFTKATQVTCAEAKEIALKVSGNNVPTELTYVVKGYVTNIVGSWSSGKQSFWIADTKDGGKVFEAYYCFISKAVTLGDYVQLFGKLTKFNTTAEMADGQATILPAPVAKFNVTVTAENGTVAGAGEYEEGKEATLTATANEGYEFTCWTSGEDTVSTANPYTFAVTANLALVANFKEVVVEPTTETVYFIDVKKWGKVNAYAWNTGGNNGWPGKAATKEAEQIAGFDVYSFTANAGQYANVIFNNKVGDTGSQTPDLVWTAGKYYVMDLGWLTKEEAEAKLAAPLPETWNIVGAAGLMGTDWNLNDAKNAMTKQADGTYLLEKKDITLTAGTYEYKAAKDHGYTVAIPQDGNQKLTISKSGIYDITFVLNVTAKKLTATATLKKEAVVIPTIVIAGDMNGWNQTKNKFTMAADSLTATFKATLTAKPYGFKMIVGGAWHSDGKTITRAANSTKFTGANSNTNSTLKADIAGEYLFTWEYATKTLTVTYPELPVEYTVTATVNPAETGTVAGAGKYEEGKEATLTATPAEGYQFVNWTVGDSIVSTENPYKFTVTADLALVANFELIPPTKYNVTVTAENGTVEGAGEYEENAEATLTATAAEGYEFVNWTVGDSIVSTENPYKFTVTADLALVANFKEAVTIITETFDLIQEEDTRNMGGTYSIYAGDYTLRIFGYEGAGTYQDDTTTVEDAAPMLFTPDYDDALNPVVVVTIDEENNKEVMQVTAASADSTKIYNLTINIALPSYEKYSLIATGIKAENETVEGMSVIKLKGEGYLNGEKAVPFEFMVFESMMGYGAEGTIGEINVFSTEAEFFAEEGEFLLKATMQDEEGKYLFNVEVMGTMPKAEVEIVVKETKDVTLYNLNLDVQGNMAMVTADNMTLSFNLTLLDTENYYGTYTNDAFSNIWYGDDQLYAAYGEAQVYAEVDGKAKFVVSFISTPDAEGNVTLYNFTLYAGEKTATGVENLDTTIAPVKMIENGQLIIMKGDTKYNAQGAKL